MLCIKNLKTEEITRVKNEVAEKKVFEGTHCFIGKQVWKASKIKSSVQDAER